MFKVLKIGSSKTNPNLSWIVRFHFKQEFVGISFKKELKFGVVTLSIKNLSSSNASNTH